LDNKFRHIYEDIGVIWITERKNKEQWYKMGMDAIKCKDKWETMVRKLKREAEINVDECKSIGLAIG
jgi:hypothetical protein